MTYFSPVRSLFLPIMLFALLLTACGGGGGGGGGRGGGGGGAGPVTSISVTPSSASMYVNRSLQLVARDNNGTDVTAAVMWGTTVGTIDANGRMTSGATGTADVTATLDALTGTATITIVAAATTFSVGGVADPLTAQQWHLNNTGQTGYADTAGTATHDINVDNVYSTYGIDGTGVIVAVVDTGLEIGHEDLSANVVPGGSWDFNGRDSDPTYPGTDGDHGTAVSGLIASARNLVGGIGVASGASLKGFNFLVSNQSNEKFVDSLGGSSRRPASRDVWIFNQSYGISTSNGRSVNSAVANQLESGTTTLRSGKGALYVKAAGNGFDDNGGVGYCEFAVALGVSCENANFDPENTLPYNIVVSALNADGVKTSYSTTGSAVWVSAPGGEYGANAAAIGAGYPALVYEPAMVTTDQSTCDAGYARTTDIITDPSSPPIYPLVYSTFGGNDGTTNDTNGTPHAANLLCNYTNNMNGTSSATPVTAGVIALMLEANPALTWRDVKHILATTSTQVDAAIGDVSVNLGTGGAYVAEPAWTTNAAPGAAGGPYLFHNWYGFGRVNADAAVAAALSYQHGFLGTFQTTGWLNSGAISVAIPDNSTVGASHTLSVPDALTIEAVQIRLSVAHSYTGDLGVELLSPSGTRSVLKNIRDGLNGNNFYDLQLTSNAFYGEPSNGVWTIKVVDGNALDSGSLTAWSVRVYGH